MPVYELNGVRPTIAASVWLAGSAEVIGRVELGEDVSVWFGTIVRGDQPEPIRIGRGSNIQDGCVLHSDAGVPLTVGDRVTVGHRAVLHGCSIGDDSLIGIGAVLLNGAKIGKRSLVAAGALVTEGKEFPDRSLILGTPAVVKRTLTAEQLAAIEWAADHYRQNAERFRRSLRKIS